MVTLASNGSQSNAFIDMLQKLTGRVEGPAEKVGVRHIVTYAVLKAAGAWQKLCFSYHWEKRAETHTYGTMIYTDNLTSMSPHQSSSEDKREASSRLRFVLQPINQIRPGLALELEI